MGSVYPTTKSTATELLSTLPDKFEAAKTSGELFFFPSTSRDIHSEGRRVCHLPLFQMGMVEEELMKVQLEIMSRFIGQAESEERSSCCSDSERELA